MEDDKEIFSYDEKHRIISDIHNNLKKSLEETYFEFTGKKVRIDIIVTYLFIILFSGCLCINPIYSNNINNSTTSTILTTSTTSTILTTSTTILYNINNVLRFVYINQTIDLSQNQRKDLMNLRSKYCFASACSAGFDECKRNTLDILNLKKSQFSERESSHYNPVIDNSDNICLPIHYSNVDDIDILLDADTWEIYNINNYTGNYSEKNITTYNNTLVLRRKY
jgi:hypothetical protein